MSGAANRPAAGRLTLVAAILASTFLMGSSFVCGKVLLNAGFPSLLLVGWRFLLAAVATLPLARLESGSVCDALFCARLSSRQATIVAIIGLTQTAAVMSLLFMAMRSVSAVTAAILLFTNPVWVALAGWLFLAPVFARLLSFVLLDSALSWLQVLGAVFIALSIWLVNRQVPDRAADFSKLALKGTRDGSGSR